MNVLLLGLGTAQAAEIQTLLSQSWPGVSSLSLPRRPDFTDPVQDSQAQSCPLCVVDMPTLGLHRYSALVEKRLLNMLAGRSAVLLSGPDAGGWPLTGIPLALRQRLVWLRQPYTLLALRDAIASLSPQLENRPPAELPAASGPESASMLFLPDLKAPPEHR